MITEAKGLTSRWYKNEFLRCSPGRLESMAPASIMYTERSAATNFRANVQPTGPDPMIRTSTSRFSIALGAVICAWFLCLGVCAIVFPSRDATPDTIPLKCDQGDK